MMHNSYNVDHSEVLSDSDITEDSKKTNTDAAAKNSDSCIAPCNNKNNTSLTRFSVDDQFGTSYAEQEFNKNRRVIIRNVPPVTYDEVKEFLGGYAISDISISKKQRHAIVTLLDGGRAEVLVKSLRGHRLLGSPVDVALYHSDNLLCITHLPFNLDEQDFRSFVEDHGAVERCFLLRSLDERSKGYGFLEYVHNQEKSREVCRSLDGSRQGSCVVRCDFLHSSIVAFSQLHSCCLLVSNLPPSFNDQRLLDSIFSEMIAPIECKMEAQSGQVFGFAVVSYSTADQAEQAQRHVNGRMVSGHKIRVSYCIPGQTASQMFDKLVKEQAISGRVGLLPAPPLPRGYTHSKMHVNPPILPQPPPQQLQAQHKPVVQAPAISQGEVDILMKTPNHKPTSISSNLASPQVHSLLSHTPQVLGHFQRVLGQLQCQINHQGTGSTRPPQAIDSTQLQNVDLQVAILAVVLAIQLQQAQPSLLTNPLLQQMLISHSQRGSGTKFGDGLAKPSLLGNPMLAQANTMLQSLFQQHQQGVSDAVDSDLSDLSNSNLFTSIANQSFNPALLANLHLLLSTAHSQQQERKSSANMSGKPGLLGDSPSSKTPGVMVNSLSHPTGSGGSGDSDKEKQTSSTSSFFDLPNVGLANPLLALYLENQIKSELLQGNTQAADCKRERVDKEKSNSLLGDYPRPATQWAGWQSTASIPEKTKLNFEDESTRKHLAQKTGSNKRNYQQISGHDNLPKRLENPMSFNQYQTTAADQSKTTSEYYQAYDYSSSYAYAQQQYGQSTQYDDKQYTHSSSTPDGGYASQTDDSYQYSNQSTGLYGSQQQVTPLVRNQPAATSTTSEVSQKDWQEYHEKYQKYLADYKAYQASQQQGSGYTSSLPMASDSTALSSTASRADSISSFSSDSFTPEIASTPFRSGRPHLLPSPEPSPVSGYIGQHSQGLGGHYADSYSKKFKL